MTEPKGIATRMAIQDVLRERKCLFCPRSADRKCIKACSQFENECIDTSAVKRELLE